MKAKVDIGTKYKVVTDEGGAWSHAEGSDFLFAYVKDEWDDSVKVKVANVFAHALSVPNAIKEAVKKVTGKDVVQGAYIAKKDLVIDAINSIYGMGQISYKDSEQHFKSTAIEINKEFFGSVLAGLGGNIDVISDYLNQSVGNLQLSVKKSSISENFGTVIGLVSLMPILNVPMVSFKYIFTSWSEKDFVVDASCASSEVIEHDFKYATVTYNYTP